MLRYVVTVSSAFMICFLIGLSATAQDAALDEEFRSRLENLTAGDLDAHIELLTWCDENHLEEHAKTVAAGIIEIDPENRRAHQALKHRRVPPGRWLTLDEYHDYRGDILLDGKWYTVQEWRRLVTEGRRKISPWSEVRDGSRVDTQHFIIFTDADERFTNDISHLAELSFIVFCELMDCREVILPPEVAKVGPDVDLSRARFVSLAEEGGAHFLLPDDLELTCWSSGAMLLRFPNGKEVLRGTGGAELMKGLDGQSRLIRPFMTADDRIILEVLRSKTEWSDLRLSKDRMAPAKGVAAARVPGDRVVLWRALSPRHEPAEIRNMTAEAYYYLAHHYVWLFASETPFWFQHAVAEFFERGTGYRGQINLRTYDKPALQQAYQRLSGSGRLLTHLNSVALAQARAYSRLVDRRKLHFPVLYAFVCYTAQKKAPGGASPNVPGGTVLQAIYRELAQGKSAQAAVEKAADQDIETFQNDMIKWLGRYSGTRSGRRSF